MTLPDQLVKVLKRNNITIEEYLYILCKHTNQTMPLFKIDCAALFDCCVNKGLLLEDGHFTSTAMLLLNIETRWIEEWRNLFPRGYKQGSQSLRGDIKAVEKKMDKFLKIYDYSKEEIFEATKKYLEEQRRDNFKYTKVAHYLIEKDGVSTLASLCEGLREGTSDIYTDIWVKKA